MSKHCCMITVATNAFVVCCKTKESCKMQKQELNVKESMSYLSVSVHRVRKLLWERKLESRKVDGRTFITLKSLSAYKVIRDNRMTKSPTYHTVKVMELVDETPSESEVIKQQQ